MKTRQAPNFSEFRRTFRAKPGRIFLVPANTFDNVTGDFPIGFQIWRTGTEEYFTETQADVYDSESNFIGRKTLFAYSTDIVINRWLNKHYDRTGKQIGWLRFVPNDFQNNRGVYITTKAKESDIRESRVAEISINNVNTVCIYFAVRLCIEATWLNDRDQFLYPNDGWQNDKEFQSNCLVFALFHGQNRISNEHGTNYWIPFTEEEVNAKEKFESHFMSDYIKGKPKKKEMTAEEREAYERDGRNYHQADVFEQPKPNQIPLNCEPLKFSLEAQAVMDAGRELWQYYHKQPNANPNASFYDIRLHFQGTKTTKNGKVQMNTESQDETYTLLISDLRQKLKDLAKKIEPKVYEYGFLKQ